MDLAQSVDLYITFVEKEGPFLKLWGQTEKNNAVYVEQYLAGLCPQFDAGKSKIHPDSLQCGTLVCAKYNDDKYYRARIVNILVRDSLVEVIFIDFGNKDIVSCENIRSLHICPSSFISIPPLAAGFIFGEAHCVGGGEWNEAIFESIAKDIKYREVQCHLLAQATQYYLVKLFLDGTDLCSLLIQRGLMQPISLQAQQAVLLSMSIQKPSTQVPNPTQVAAAAAINTYKAITLDSGEQHPVYVSYINDGPCQFSVQLKKYESVLANLMKDINCITLRLLEDIPIPGTLCLARCQEDGNVCRAVVTNEVDNQFKVYYVDFGNYEIVSLDSLFQIPFKYIIPKVMAIRFALAGVEKSTVTHEMQVAFKNFVDNRLLHMTVLQARTRMAIPKCELWDPKSETSALDVVIRAVQHAYPEPISLNKGFSQPVKVSFVYSCNRFYIQLVSKENELAKLMMDLQEICLSNSHIQPNEIRVGLPCCALFLADNQWYRSQVVEILGENVKVRYIDFGNEEVVHITQLKTIDGEQLTVLVPQAVECCLNGYQNMEDDAERDGFLEEIILEDTFTMKVVEMSGKKALVELFDASNYNVSSLLLDKIAAAKSQVSPMLVQAGNKIEHRKSYSQRDGQTPQREGQRDNFRGDRDHRTQRDDSTWNGRSNDRNDNPWRQDNRGNRPNHQRQRNQDGDSWNNRDNNANNSDWSASETLKRTSPNDTWENTAKNDGWNAPAGDNELNQNRRQNDYGRNNRGFNNERGSKYDNDRGDRFSGRKREGGYAKNSDFRKDGSEQSSSGSEKNSPRGPRTSSRNDKVIKGGKFERNYEKPRSASRYNNSIGDNSWNVSPVVPSIDAAPVTSSFATMETMGTQAKVNISWFHNPGHFFCQITDSQAEFKSLMEDIQEFYKNRKPEKSVVGAPVIGLFPEDNVLYRAQLLEKNGNRYKVYYVDFGNVSTVDKIWPIDKKFMNLPAQAIVCSLNGIVPCSGSWSDPDTYSKYFEKESFTCEFINKDEEKTYVNIFYESQDIAQLLIKDGLAVSTQSVIPDIEIPLLLGQEFRAVMKSVNNPGDIIIALECGVAVSCYMHNLETATEIFEDVLRGLLEQTVIVYVDNVIDDRLEVTLYDTEGNKHVILNPDEGAIDTVECPCPMLVLRSTITGYVPHADESSIFIQPSEYSEIITYLLDQLYETYNEQILESPIIPEEGLLYAVHSEDDNWYRGRVVSFDDEKCTVFYVDYGNSEDVAFSQLRELTPDFLAISLLCIQINVSSDATCYIDKEVIATIVYGENGWEGTVDLLESSAAESSNLDELTESGFNSGSLEKADEVQYNTEPSICVEEVSFNYVSPDAANCADTQNETTIPNIDVETQAESDGTIVEDGEISQHQESIEMGTPVYISHIDSPNEFYIQFPESVPEIEELQEVIQIKVTEWSVLESPSAGIICAAPYSVDQKWYRAEILDADDDITTVRFIDFGNTDVIDNKTTQLKTLPPNLLTLAVYATRSSLKLESPDKEWSSAAILVFEKLASVENLRAEFLDQNEKTHYVELYSEGTNIKEEMIRLNLAVMLEQTEETKLTGFVSHLNSPSEFWIQLENCVDELEWIAEQLSSAESFPEQEDLTPGSLCAALFPDDQMWYRARILSNTVAGIELLFIDYGNSCTSSSLRQLPEDLVVTAPLAQKCSLQKPEGISVWSAEAAAKFSEISAEGQTIFTVKKINVGETSIVQLLLNGEDVSTMLLPITEDGYVKAVDGLEKLQIEKSDGEAIEGIFQLEAMSGQELNEEAERNFEQINSQGSTLFQIEFINKNTVRLYLNGFDIRPKLGGIKNDSLDSSEIENIDLFSNTKYTEKETEIENNGFHEVENNVVSNEIDALNTVENNNGNESLKEEVDSKEIKIDVSHSDPTSCYSVNSSEIVQGLVLEIIDQAEESSFNKISDVKPSEIESVEVFGITSTIQTLNIDTKSSSNLQESVPQVEINEEFEKQELHSNNLVHASIDEDSANCDQLKSFKGLESPDSSVESPEDISNLEVEQNDTHEEFEVKESPDDASPVEYLLSNSDQERQDNDDYIEFELPTSKISEMEETGKTSVSVDVPSVESSVASSKGENQNLDELPDSLHEGESISSAVAPVEEFTILPVSNSQSSFIVESSSVVTMKEQNYEALDTEVSPTETSSVQKVALLPVNETIHAGATEKKKLEFSIDTEMSSAAVSVNKQNPEALDTKASPIEISPVDEIPIFPVSETMYDVESQEENSHFSIDTEENSAVVQLKEQNLEAPDTKASPTEISPVDEISILPVSETMCDAESHEESSQFSINTEESSAVVLQKENPKAPDTKASPIDISHVDEIPILPISETMCDAEYQEESSQFSIDSEESSAVVLQKEQNPEAPDTKASPIEISPVDDIHDSPVDKTMHASASQEPNSECSINIEEKENPEALDTEASPTETSPVEENSQFFINVEISTVLLEEQNSDAVIVQDFDDTILNSSGITKNNNEENTRSISIGQKQGLIEESILAVGQLEVEFQHLSKSPLATKDSEQVYSVGNSEEDQITNDIIDDILVTKSIENESSPLVESEKLESCIDGDVNESCEYSDGTTSSKHYEDRNTKIIEENLVPSVNDIVGVQAGKAVKKHAQIPDSSKCKRPPSLLEKPKKSLVRTAPSSDVKKIPKKSSEKVLPSSSIKSSIRVSLSVAKVLASKKDEDSSPASTTKITSKVSQSSKVKIGDNIPPKQPSAKIESKPLPKKSIKAVASETTKKSSLASSSAKVSTVKTGSCKKSTPSSLPPSENRKKLAKPGIPESAKEDNKKKNRNAGADGGLLRKSAEETSNETVREIISEIQNLVLGGEKKGSNEEEKTEVDC
ncbi:protein tudor isoform X2 [Leptinotarsa decemlineata]|uniref:protein tudor isoform X2 n=1 Tax=Leptinotarsa decemlineata TaxID=7539 RepID=UPI003D30822B